jgi:hypothetical protein
MLVEDLVQKPKRERQDFVFRRLFGASRSLSAAFRRQQETGTMGYRPLLPFILIVALLGCDSGDNPSGPASVTPDESDSQGNLVIRNLTGERLVLYRGSEQRLRVLPDDQTDYLVNVPNPNADRLDLRMYRLSDIADDIDAPGAAEAIKRWDVALASDTEIEHRSTWAVLDNDAERNSGTLTFSYVGGTENSVDVYLNEQTGAKIASLRPGAERKQVGVDYGNYTLHYNYWYSDPNTASAAEDRGWTEAETVNQLEVAIYAVLNANRQTQHLQVPHLGVELKPWGTLNVFNSTATPVQLWAGAALIESIVYTDGSTQNVSTVAANETVPFILPVGDHLILAKTLDSNAEIGRIELELGDGQNYIWDVGTGSLTGSLLIGGVLPE